MKNIRKIVSSLGTINEISLYFNETETEKAKNYQIAQKNIYMKLMINGLYLKKIVKYL